MLRARAAGDRLPRDAILRALVEMANAGLLISERALLTSLAQEERPTEELPKLAAWGVLTRNRPEAVSQCVRTFSANLQEHRRDATCTVIDSSPADLAARTLSALLRGAPSGSELWYAGVAEKAAFAEQLARASGLDSSLTRFALLDVEHVGRDTGTNRNALLLAHAGAPFLSVDDDVLCDIRHASDPEESDIEPFLPR